MQTTLKGFNMKNESYEQMEKRLNRKSWVLIAIAVLMPLLFILSFPYLFLLIGA